MMQTTQTSNSLSKAQIERYWQNGFLCPIPAISTQQCEDWRAELEAIESDWLDNGLPRALNVYKRVNAHLVMPLAYEIAAHSAILDVVEGILGPDVLLYSTEFLIKEPHTKHVVTMHQDLAYWGLGEIDGILTAWLALTPATPQSGCMDFVKGSHKSPIIPHEDSFDELNLLSRGQEIKVNVAEEDKSSGALATGEMSLHHGLMIHGSGANTSDDRRIGVVMRFLSPHVKKPNNAPDYGVAMRGNCDTGNFTLCHAPKGLFNPEDLLIYEEIRTEQARVMMAGAEGKAAMYA
jgi:hypothetical protein